MMPHMVDISDDLMRLEQQLASPLPDDYRGFLQEPAPTLSEPLSENRFIPLHFYPLGSNFDRFSFPRVVNVFLREWHALGGVLCPVEYLGKGLFACMHLLNPLHPSPPVVLWDVSADLAEQSFFLLASDWTRYLLDRQSGFDPVRESFDNRRRRRIRAEFDFKRSVETFNDFSKWFHSQYRDRNQNDPFQHDRQNKLPRYDEWRPERFCVHDHLLGVMGYRFSPLAGRMEVTGFVTRDHTNYARGSATRALLTGLLTELAKQSAPAGITFVDQWTKDTTSPVPMPIEVSLFAHLQGISIQPGTCELTAEECRKLLARLTPIKAEVSRSMQTAHVSEKACLLVQKQILLPSQVEDLVCHCPLAEDLFKDQIHMEEQIRLTIAMEHLQLSFMTRVIEQVVTLAAETSGGEVEFERGASNEPVLPYGRLIRCRTPLRMRGITPTGPTLLTLPENFASHLIPWPVDKSGFEQQAAAFFRHLENLLRGENHPLEYVVIPEESIGEPLPEGVIPCLSNIPILTVSETYLEIRKTAWQAFQKITQLRT